MVQNSSISLKQRFDPAPPSNNAAPNQTLRHTTDPFDCNANDVPFRAIENRERHRTGKKYKQFERCQLLVKPASARRDLQPHDAAVPTVFVGNDSAPHPRQLRSRSQNRTWSWPLAQRRIQTSAGERDARLPKSIGRRQ